MRQTEANNSARKGGSRESKGRRRNATEKQQEEQGNKNSKQKGDRRSRHRTRASTPPQAESRVGNSTGNPEGKSGKSIDAQGGPLLRGPLLRGLLVREPSFLKGPCCGGPCCGGRSPGDLQKPSCHIRRPIVSAVFCGKTQNPDHLGSALIKIRIISDHLGSARISCVLRENAKSGSSRIKIRIISDQLGSDSDQLKSGSGL